MGIIPLTKSAQELDQTGRDRPESDGRRVRATITAELMAWFSMEAPPMSEIEAEALADQMAEALERLKADQRNDPEQK
jgi:hypothetical protein